MFPYRISCTIVHVPRRSPIPSHVYYSLASRDNTSVVHRGSDRSILFADLPVSRIRVAQSVSSSFGFPDNTRNTPVHFSASLSRTEGETRRGRFLYRNRNAWIVVREWTMRRGSRIRSYLDWIKICIVRGKRWSPIFGRTTETTSTRRVRMRVVKLNTRDPDALRINAKHVSRRTRDKLNCDSKPYRFRNDKLG